MVRYKQVFPAVRPHPKTGEPCWFNQLHAHHYTFYKAHPKYYMEDEKAFDRWPVNSRYGDGATIPMDVLDHVRETVWRNTVALPMRKGDLLIADNYLAKHGR